MSIINILLVILLLCSSALCIFLIIYLKRIIDQLETLGKEIHQLVESTNTMMNNIDAVALRANRIVSDVEGYWAVVSRVIKSFRKLFSRVSPFMKRL
ncbi:MAG: hypothetical protein C4517_09450 [Stygiobacter sp.]|nr:MAG: hypothetical protein C4517_09450 [Stygiobacter sp.]